MAIAGFFAGAVKTQNAIAVGAAAFFLLLTGCVFRGGRISGRRSLVASCAGVIAFVAAQIAWLAARAYLAVGVAPKHGTETHPTLALLVRETSAFVFRLGLGATEDGQPVPTHAVISTALLVASVGGAILYRRLNDPRAGLAISVAALVIFGSPLLILAEHFATGDVVPSPTRYGASLLAGAGALTATAFDTRRRGGALLLFGCSLVAIVVVGNLIQPS
jgi:hypothetical protein